MEINRKSKNKKIRKYAISRFNQHLNQSLYLTYESCNPPQNQNFIPEDLNNHHTRSPPKKLVYRQKNPSLLKKPSIDSPTQRIQQSEIESNKYGESILNEEYDNNFYSIDSESPQKKQNFLFKENLESVIDKYRNIKIEREKKNLGKLSGTNGKEKLLSGSKYQTQRTRLVANQLSDIKSQALKTFKKRQLKRNDINPHYIEMDISVDPECVINGTKRLPSMNFDKSLLGKSLLQECSRKTLTFLGNPKNVFDPVFRAQINQKNEELFNKEQFNKKFENFLGKKQDGPTKISYSEHLKMKEEAYKKKQIQLVSKFTHKTQPQNQLTNYQRTLSISQTADQTHNESTQKTRKPVNIANIKPYQQLIRNESAEPFRNRNILKSKFKKKKDHSMSDYQKKKVWFNNRQNFSQSKYQSRKHSDFKNEN